MAHYYINKLTDFFIAKGDHLSYTEKNKSRVFISSCFITSLLLLITTINRFFLQGEVPYSSIGIALLLFTLPFVFKKTQNYNKISIIFPMLAIVSAPPIVYYRGGLAAPQAIWFILFPIISFYYTGPKIGLRLTLTGLCSLIVLLTLHITGHKFPEVLPLPERQILHSAITVISIYLLISYLTWHYEKLNLDIQDKLIRSEQKALKANRTKDVFWANISHEIRTPLNGILGMTNLILDSRITPEQKELVEIIKDSAENLNIILSDVIDYSKIETNELEIEKRPFNLAQCLEQITQLFYHMAHEKNINISYSIDSDVPQGILTDESRLRQVLINLVANAVKFTEQGHVKILVERSNRKDTLNFYIEDTGIGIAKEKIERLFRPFTQVDDGLTRKYGGTGLGLVICKKILNLLGGDIKVESKMGVGSTFHFTLKVIPIKVGNHIRSGFQDISQGLAKTIPLKVLIAEDNPVNRKLLTSLLSKNHIFPDSAENGLEAFELAKKNEYDLIFMDIQMPIMDGITATKKIIEFHKNKRPKIVAVTANVLQEDRDRCFEAGMDDFMAKPINNNILVSILERYSHQVTQTKVFSSYNTISDQSAQVDPHHLDQSYEVLNIKKVPIIDRQYETFNERQLLINFADDIFIIESIFNQFLARYTEDLESIQESIQEKNYSLLKMNAHTLKGTFSTLFSEEGKNYCNELEELGKKETTVGAELLFEELKLHCDQLIVEFELFLKERKAA